MSRWGRRLRRPKQPAAGPRAPEPLPASRAEGPDPPPPGVPTLPAGAEAFRGLTKHSLDLAAVRVGEGGQAAVNVVLPPFQLDRIFAGVATALQTGRRLASALGRPLRVIPLGSADPAASARSIADFLGTDGGAVPSIEVVPRDLIARVVTDATDVWVVTYWTTAHAADVACRLGVLDPARVVYLVQDYEPGFHAWSVPHALTRGTYHCGFTLVVNSRSLAHYLGAREEIEIDPDLVFAPHLEFDRLRSAADSRAKADVVRVFFYARPSKPRNLHALGVAALNLASVQLARDGIEWECVAAGGEMPDLALASGDVARSLGIVTWDEYFDLLGRVDVGLSLMYSPHPSHPPLELAVSGARAVTNELDGTRTAFHERIRAVAADPNELAEALVGEIRRAASEGPQPFAPPVDGVLGRPLDDVIGELASRLA